MLTAGLPELTSVKDIQYLKVLHTRATGTTSVCVLCAPLLLHLSFAKRRDVEEKKQIIVNNSNEVHLR